MRLRPIGDGNAGVGCGADGRGHTGDDFKRNASVVQGTTFFTAAAEDEGVAPFETDDDVAGTGLFEE